MNKPNPTSCNHEAYLQNKYELKFLVACHHQSYILDAATLSGILKTKQKLGVTFNSDKLGGIDFTKFIKLGGSIDIDFSKNLVCKV